MLRSDILKRQALLVALVCLTLHVLEGQVVSLFLGLPPSLLSLSAVARKKSLWRSLSSSTAASPSSSFSPLLLPLLLAATESPQVDLCEDIHPEVKDFRKSFTRAFFVLFDSLFEEKENWRREGEGEAESSKERQRATERQRERERETERERERERLTSLSRIILSGCVLGYEAPRYCGRTHQIHHGRYGKEREARQALPS